MCQHKYPYESQNPPPHHRNHSIGAVGWAITGIVFFIKPGYTSAYELLTPKTYPLDGKVPVTADPDWREFRCFRTILGDHLIALTVIIDRIVGLVGLALVIVLTTLGARLAIMRS